ncbi:MAG: DNRLRE domain-containing protein, partial [Nitrospirota bacterium]
EFCIVNSTGAAAAALTALLQPAKRVVSIGFSQFDLGWAVGDNGTILQWNGVEWVAAPAITDRNLRAVRLTSLDRGWAAGDWGVMGEMTASAWSKNRSAYLFLPANGGNELAVFDTDAYEVGRPARVKSINLAALGAGGATDVALTPNGRYLYVTRNGAVVNNVIVLDAEACARDPAACAVERALTVGANPRGIAVSPDGLRVYVVNEGARNISVILRNDEQDPDQDTLDPTPIGLSNANSVPRYMVLSLDGNKAFVTTGGSGVVEVLDVTAGVPLAPIALGDDDQWGVAIHPNGYYAYVAGRQTDRVYAIDTVNNSMVEGMNVGGEPLGISYTRDGLEAYVSKNNANRVLALNTSSNTQGADTSVDAGPSGLANSADGAEIYVTNVAAGRVNIIRVKDKTLGDAETVAATGAIAAAPARSFKSVSMLNGSEGWAVGADGQILHWDGAGWTVQPLAAIDLPCPPDCPPDTESIDEGIWRTTIQPDENAEDDAYVRMNDDYECASQGLPTGCTNGVNYNQNASPEAETLGLRRVGEDAADPNNVNNPLNEKIHRPYLRFHLGTVKQYALSVLDASLQLYAYDVIEAPSGSAAADGTDLVLRYQFDNDCPDPGAGCPPGTQIVDASTSLNHGTNYGGAAYDYADAVDQQLPYYLSFDGVDDRIIKLSSSLKMTTAVTVAVRVKFTDPNQLVSGASRELIRRGVTASRLTYMLWVKDGKPAFTVCISTGCGIAANEKTAVSGDPPIEANRWYYLAGTYDGQAVRIFQDDSWKAELPAPGTIYSPGFPTIANKCGGWGGLSADILCIGGTNQAAIDGRGNSFQGSMEESQIYKRALALDELRKLAGWGKREVNVHRVLDPWNNETVDGATQPNCPSPSCQEIFGSTTVTAQNLPKWVYWNITRLVQQWVDDTDPNFGVTLRVGLRGDGNPPGD